MSGLYTDAVRVFPGNLCEPRINILTQPVDIACRIGTYANLSANVWSPNPSFQWFDQLGNPIQRGDSSCLPFGPVEIGDFGFYRLEIVDRETEEKLLTRWVELKNTGIFVVPVLPSVEVISHKPILLSSSPGGSYKIGSTFTLNASFRNATAYQWYKDGERLEGCKGNTLVINNANMSNNGMFVLSATNCPFSGLMELAEGIKVVIY